MACTTRGIQIAIPEFCLDRLRHSSYALRDGHPPRRAITSALIPNLRRNSAARYRTIRSEVPGAGMPHISHQRSI
jgi:hypothetical protein